LEIDTIEEVKSNIQEAIAFYLEGMQEDSLSIPQPTTECEYVEVAALG